MPGLVDLRAAIASMRPQRDAAENRGREQLNAVQVELIRAASMRPQRDAAENDGLATDLDRLVRASMRPQRDAAENLKVGFNDLQAKVASMRPQRDAAENAAERAAAAGTGGLQ